MQGSDDVERWQDVAENLADPFVSPFDKPALVLKLVQRAPDVAQTLSDVVQGKEQPDKMLGSRAQRQLRGVQAVSRQLTQDVLPDALPQVQRVVEEVSRNPQLVGGGGIQGGGDGGGVQRVVQILDDLTANGKFPTLPSFSDVAGELRQVFESTPQGLETPEYKLLMRTEEYEIRCVCVCVCIHTHTHTNTHAHTYTYI
jgi:hypothetical protein